MKNQKGFTLIELLIVIGIIAILASAVIVAINPGQQFAEARNSTRRNHLSTVASAVHSWAAMENNGVYPNCLESGDGNGVDINSELECTPADGGEAVGLEELLSDYINQLPDPPTGEDEQYMAELRDGSPVFWVQGTDEWDADEEISQ